MMQMQNVDVVIVGGGMVGLGLAAALKNSALTIAIVEGQLPDTQLGEAPDNRVSALSLASQRILQGVGAWDGIVARRLQPYDSMEVWEQDSFGHIGFDAASLRQPALGHIVENRVIQLALLDAIAGANNISLLTPARAQSLQVSDAGALLLLEDGRALSAKVVVGADGVHSPLRALLFPEIGPLQYIGQGVWRAVMPRPAATCAAARAATRVLPEPTSPWIMRRIGTGRPMSMAISE